MKPKQATAEAEELKPRRRGKGPFQSFAHACVRVSGYPQAFFLAVLAILIWAVTGPLFHFSDTWQLVINTATTIITFLMVFLIQNAQNRDSDAIQLKLDELIRANSSAHNHFVDLEDLSEEELTKIRVNFEKLAQKAEKVARSGKKDCGSPEVQGHGRVNHCNQRSSVNHTRHQMAGEFTTKGQSL